MRARFISKNAEGVRTVGLKAPSIITFMLSVILAVIVLMSTFFGAEIPGLKGNELSGHCSALTPSSCLAA
jgi:hypothetical protein